MSLEPIVRSVSLPCTRAIAFSAFTNDIGQWWESRLSASGDELAGVVLEARVGGRLFEVSADGDEHDWGTVTDWLPDQRITLEWTLGLAAGTTSAVDVDFAADPAGGTTMRLEHGGWGEDQERDRAKFADPLGWDVLLKAYLEHVTAIR